jgi:hypothetical protein
MTTRMLKYTISAGQERTTVAMRSPSTFRAIGVQRSREVCLWFEVADDAPPVMVAPTLRTFEVVPTGGEIPEPSVYIGTAHDGPYVWHIYEVLL